MKNRPCPRKAVKPVKPKRDIDRFGQQPITGDPAPVGFDTLYRFTKLFEHYRNMGASFFLSNRPDNTQKEVLQNNVDQVRQLVSNHYIVRQTASSNTEQTRNQEVNQ